MSATTAAVRDAPRRRGAPRRGVRRAAAARPDACSARHVSSSSSGRSCSRSCSSSSSRTCSRRSARAIGGPSEESTFSSLLVPGVIAIAMHLPGDPGGRAAARPGVRLHARDRGPRAGAAPGLGASPARSSSPARCRAVIAAAVVFPLASIIPATPVHLRRAVAAARDDPAARGHRARLVARPGHRHRVEPAEGPAHLRAGRDPDHVPRRDVLPVGDADADPVAQGARAA